MNVLSDHFDAASPIQKREAVNMNRTSPDFVRAIIFFSIILVFTTIAQGQNYLTSTGFPSFAAPEPVELGTVDAASGNLHLSIPLGSYPQRGTSQPQAISLEYDSNIWNEYVNGLTVQWQPKNGPGGLLAGWYYSFEGSGWTISSEVVQGCWTDFTWADQNGSQHSFHVNQSYIGGQGCPSTGDAFATDSSGFHIYITANDVLVYAPDGTLVHSDRMVDQNNRRVLAKDSNGNYMSVNVACPSSVYDTLGRLMISASSVCGGTSFPVAVSQGTAQYSQVYATINLKTNFQQSGVQETTPQVTVVRSLTLPDPAHSTYSFTYDCDSSSGNAACGSPGGQSAYYGEIIGITLPTGEEVRYVYSTFTDAYNNKVQRVSERFSQGGTWNYSPQVISTCSATSVNCKQQTTVTSPTGAQTLYTFQLNNGAWPISTVQKDASGNALTTVNNTYDMSQSCVLNSCHGNNFIRLLTQQATVYTPGGALTKQTSYTYDSPQTGNRTAVKEWKYISGTSFSSVPDRATYMTYLTTGTNNINRPSSVTLCNNSGSDSACPGGGSKVSQTLNSYDIYGASGLTSITGVAQHDDTNFGAGYTTGRGNVTSSSHWVSGSAYLTSSYTYDTTGQVLKETDPAGNITQYGYSDAFFTDGGNDTTPSAYTSSPSTNAYRTSVSDVLGSQTIGYYWGSGRTATTTDYNGAVTTSHYQDGLDRQTEEIDPVGWKLATFTSATQADMYTAVGDTSPSTGCSSCQHSQELLDGWGRATSSIFVNNPIGQVNLDSTYDDAGQLASQSHPYSGTSDPNHVFETSGYDALGRQISIAHPDSQLVQAAFGAMIGGLGGVTAQQGSVSTYGYGYPQISEDESGHQHQGWTDGFGRIIEADEPSTSTSTLATTTVSVSAGSGGQSQIVDPCQACKQFGCPPCPYTQWNSGVVSLTVGGYTANAPYGPSGSTYDTTSQVAAELTATFNSDSNSPVTASGTGASIILTSKGPGASGNLAVSSSETWYTSTCGTTSPCFLGPAFVVSPSSGSLSGGSGGIDSSPLYTNYTYDAADHLTNVVQGVQTRTFAYDGLGRKITETTPEAGTVTYSYTTSGGALCSGDASSACRRTDARGVISTYSYDAANRLAGITYTIPGGKNIAAMPNVCTTTPSGSSANVCYHYDQGGATAHAIGRLTNMTDPTGSETTTYYVDGNVKQISKVISGQTYNLGYQYDAGGDVTQITYPSGRVVYQAYNSIGQLCLVSPSSSGCSGTSNYAGSFSYNAPGNLTGFSYGNGVSAAFSYSAPRAQLSSLKYTFGTQTYFNLGYWYQKDSTNCLNGATQNNGAIQCITDSADSGRTVNYAYDALGRMITAKTNGSSGYPQWGLSESYDRYGNRWTQALTAGSGPSVSLTFGASGMGSSTTNQPSGYTFDASGNMTVEPLSPPNNMTYDGENRMTAFSGNGGGASYTYDGNGLRVVKAVSGGTTTVSVLAGSSVIAEYDNGVAPTAPSREYIYNPAGGATTGLLAMISAGATTYYHQDHLSARLTTNASGSILSQDGSFPFGESWYTSGTGNQWFFTSYDRDSESGLDYALARYYDSRTGTFCSADPLAGSPDDPQSWNRYPYGRNDPIAITDPSGKALWSDILELGISIAAAVFAPEIDTFLGGLFPESDAAFAAEPAAHAGGTFAGLITRGATTAATVADGAGDAAAAATSGYAGLGAAAALATDHPKKPSKLCNDANAVNFVKSHQADASSVAKQLGVPTENVLGLSAHESTWGTGPFISRNGLGDAFFSEEGGTQPALSNGVMHPTEDLGKSVWSFPTYLASAQAFAARYGKYVKGVTDPSQFSGNLLKKHFNTGTKAGNGTPGWSGQVVRDIANTATRMKCP